MIRMRKLLMCALVLLISSCPGWANTKIVFVAGHDSHGPDAHEHTRGCYLLAGLLEEARPDIDTVVVSKGYPGDSSVFKDADAVVVYCDGGGGHLLNNHLEEFDALMKKGVGLVQLHYGVETTKGPCGDKFLDWMGGYFETHWSVNPHWEANFLALPDHPISRGVKPFKLVDEWYFHMRFRPEMKDVTPILSAIAPPETMQRGDGPHSGNPDVRADVAAGKAQHVGWAATRPDGGRGFGFTGGHFHGNWQHDDFRMVVENAICWAAQIEIPNEGIKTRTPTDEEMKDRSPYVSRRSAAIKAKTLKPVFISPEITSRTPGHASDINVDITGWKSLVLVAHGGAEISFDHAIWAEPRLTGPKGTLKLTDLKWTQAAGGWGEVNINKCSCGTALMLDGKPVPYGIGAHAASRIVYDLPEGYDTFLAHAGLDDSAFKDGAEKASVTFAVSDEPFSVEAHGLVPTEVEAVPNYYPAEQLVLPEGLEATLWAKSPLFFNPTNMDIDDKGRIWVAEGRNYRNKMHVPDGDRIVVVEDKDGDGQAESSHVFVQEKMFIAPLGIAVVDHRVIVSQPPDLIVYTDVNRNAVYDEGVDTREVLLTGFDGNNHDHSLHSVTVGPNGQYYFNHGNKGSSVTDRDGWLLNAGSFYSNTDVSGKPSSDGQVYVGGVALRVNPDGTGLRPIGHNFRNSYEQAVSSFGDVFQSDNDDPPACRSTWLMEYANMGFASRNGLRNWRSDQLPGQEIAVAEWRQEDPGVVPAGDVYGGGSPTGVAFYENGLLEDRLGGHFITCEPGRNTLFDYLPMTDGAGISLSQRNIFLTSNPEGDFVGSDFRQSGTRGGHKTLFRPSDVTIGPDGALYVADWWDARVGGHQTLDDTQAGAIYRIAPKGAKLAVPKWDLSTTAGQIAALKNPSPNVRELGRARLEAAGESAVPAIRALLADVNPFIQARATWLLAKLGPDGLAAVEERLSHADPQNRIVAFRALRHEGHKVLEHAARLASDAAPAVRREVAIAMRYVSFEQSRDILLNIAAGYDGQDRSYVEAFGIGATDKEASLYAALRERRGAAAGFDPVYANLVWRLHPVSAISELEDWALDGNNSPECRRSMLIALSLIEAPQAAVSMQKMARTTEGDVAALAKFFVEKRGQGIWSTYDFKDAPGGLGTGPGTYVDMLVPTQLADARKLPGADEILALKGDAARGKVAVARCVMCHEVGATGVSFGPSLNDWGRGKTPELILQALLDPSAELAHGFESAELTVRGGKRIQGIVQAEGDPLIIRVFGGKDIAVATIDLVSRKDLKTSLMIPADKLGTSPQELRDIVEFLKPRASESL
ncbi:MAG: NPCBM/NEW2 domain-containing protein [Verrucomicrobia bacterium]|nr:NPCBM/NEW2 domain-containing protein [Verrucomicrobiota bacterium]